MNMNAFKIAGLAALLLLMAGGMYLYRPNRNTLTRITVVGDSETKVAPDTAILTFSVVTQGKQALNAQQENARKSEAVKQAVEAITANSKTEIQTSDYSLNPEQDYYSGKMPKILGYEVKNTVRISIDNLDQVGAIIDAATKAGANSINGIQFVVGEASPAQGDALAMASKQAMAKAESVARSLNGKIVRVVETREGGVPVQFLQEFDSYASAASNSAAKSIPTPVQSGPVNMRSQVILVVDIAI